MFRIQKQIIKSRKKSFIKGFTFIEIVLVVSMAGIISVAVYRSLSNGIKIWKRDRSIAAEEDAMIFFDKISQDLKNSFSFSQIGFEGRFNNMSFPTVVRSFPDNSEFDPGEYIYQVGRVEYYYDTIRKTLFRKQADYGRAVNDKFETPSVMVHPVSRVRFRYYKRMPGGFGFSDESGGSMPVAVEITLEIPSGKKTYSISRIISVPNVVRENEEIL